MDYIKVPKHDELVYWKDQRCIVAMEINEKIIALKYIESKIAELSGTKKEPKGES